MVKGDVKKRLWTAANQLWANTSLKPSEYSIPVLGLLFLCCAERKLLEAEARLKESSGNDSYNISKADCEAEGVTFLPSEARPSYLLSLRKEDNIGEVINAAMRAIEDENINLKGALPHTYTRIDNTVLIELLKLLAPVELTGDAFGKVYEYFLGKFALAEGQKGGVFYTPEAIVKLIVEVIEPYHGRIYDPACGSGGMFVHSADFVERHHRAVKEISIFGAEKDQTTLNLSRMNLALHGLSGNLVQANTFYEDPHNAVNKRGGRFDFVMANPPFNVSGVDKKRLKDGYRFPYGLPSTDNANYLWISLFYAALNDTGRAGFVMANSAGDARSSESAIRRKIIKTGAVDVIVSVGPKFFYTVPLPCALWFFDKGKIGQDREDTVLFIDARSIYRQVDRAHCDFTPHQIEFLANIVRLYQGETIELNQGSETLLTEKGLRAGYVDVPGLCKIATRAEIAAQDWSLNPGRYVGAAAREVEDLDFIKSLGTLNAEFETLNAEARELEDTMAKNIASLLSLATEDGGRKTQTS